MRKLQLSSILMLGAMAAAPALAADLPARMSPPPIPAPIPVFTWTGFYVGAHAGFGSGSDTTKEYLTAGMIYVGLQNTFKPKGVFGGLHAGANYQFSNNLVAGIEGEFNLTKFQGGFVDPPAPPANPGGRGRTVLDNSASLRLRLGYAMGHVLPYLTGGIATGKLHSTYWNWGGVSEQFRKNHTGFTAGAGVEYAVTANVSVRAEYLFTQFNLVRNNSLVAFPGFTGTQEPKYHTFRAGLSYRF